MCPPNSTVVMGIDPNTRRLLIDVVDRKKKGFGLGASPGGRVGYIRHGMPSLIVNAGYFQSGHIRWRLTPCGQRVAEFLRDREKMADTTLTDDFYDSGLCPLEEDIDYHGYERWVEKGDGSPQRNPRRGPGQPGHLWLKEVRQPLHYLRTEVNNVQRSLDQINDLLEELQQNIGSLRQSEFSSLVEELLLLMNDSEIIPMLNILKEELKRISANAGLRPLKRKLIDWAHRYNVREQQRLRDYDKLRDRAMSYPWIDVYDHALGLGGEVYFVSDDRRLAGFTIPKMSTNTFTNFIDSDPNYTWKSSNRHYWLLADQPSLIVVECASLHSERDQIASMEQRKSKYLRKRRSRRPY